LQIVDSSLLQLMLYEAKKSHLMLIWSEYLPLPPSILWVAETKGWGLYSICICIYSLSLFLREKKRDGREVLLQAWTSFFHRSSFTKLLGLQQFTILQKETLHPLKYQGSYNLYVLLLIAQVIWIAVFTLRFLWILKFVILV